MFSICKEISIADSSKLKHTIAKLKKVREALNDILLPLRDDSRLVWAFVTDQLDHNWPFERVIHELALHHYLYNYTCYRSYIQDISFQKQELMNTVFKDIDQEDAKYYADKFIRDYMLPYRRMVFMLNEHQPDEMPNIWPWLVQAVDNYIGDSH